jgi:hypothetical protein
MPMVATMVKGGGQAAAGIVEGGFTAIAGAKAAERAGNAQQAAADQASGIQGRAKTEALQTNKDALEKSRADLQPYADAGTTALPKYQEGIAGVSSLVTDPNVQKDFISNNPLFEALSKRATNTLFNNQAAKGKVGSGGTAEALQNSLLLLGTDLINQNVNQRLDVNNQFGDLVNLGSTSATNQANFTNSAAGTDIGTITGIANNQSDLRLQSGNAQAASIIGRYNARNAGNIRASQGALQGLTTVADGFGAGGGGGMMGSNMGGGGMSLCDRRAKENIEKVGKLNNGFDVYRFNYKGDDEIRLNVMAQDVEKVMPDAVTEHNGFKYVNMEMVCR